MTFRDGAAALGVGVLNGAGVATLTTSSLAVGPHSITAAYAGNANYGLSTSPAIQQVVNLLVTTTTVALSPGTVVVGQKSTVKVTVTGTSTGTVTFSSSVVADVFSSANCVLVASTCSVTVTPTAPTGTHTIKAVFLGDATHASSAGNSPLTVNPYTFIGFSSPLATAGSPSGSFSLGSSVDVEWRLKDAQGNFIVNKLSTLQSVKAIFNPAGPPTGTCPITTTGTVFPLYPPIATGTTFTYESGDNEYAFDWLSTGVAGKGCYTISVQLNDGTVKMTSLRLQ